MGKKFSGGNTKAIEAKEKKSAARKEEQEKKIKQKEDALWEDDAKHLKAKEERKKKEEEKRLAALQRKAENRELAAQEEREIVKKYGNKGAQKLTRAEMERQREAEAKKKADAAKKKTNIQKQKEEQELQPNYNQILREAKIEAEQNGQELIDARSLEDAVAQLSTTEADRNPEKRLKAAFKAYEETNLPILKQENPSLKLSQLKELLWKQWQKAPENPLNQQQQ